MQRPSARSGVTDRRWPLVKPNSFILVWESLYCSWYYCVISVPLPKELRLREVNAADVRRIYPSAPRRETGVLFIPMQREPSAPRRETGIKSA